MIWAILAAIGVPLWLCAIGILVLVFNNRKLRKREGNLPVRVHPPGKKRWTRGHAIWISDVFAWRGSPAAWNEDLLHVSDATLRSTTPEERKKLHGLGDDPELVTLALQTGELLDVAVSQGRGKALLGPFARPSTNASPASGMRAPSSPVPTP